MLGVAAIQSFPFVTPPSAIALRKAFELLLMLAALQKVTHTLTHGSLIIPFNTFNDVSFFIKLIF
jgi:HrpA-like RNA helicase